MAARAYFRQRSSPPLGVVKEEVAVLIVLVRWHRRAVGAAVRRAVDDEFPGAVEEEAGPAAVFLLGRKERHVGGAEGRGV